MVCWDGGGARGHGQVRICVDLTKLNESVCRKRHQLPALEQTLAQIAGAQVFSKLDANSGFWQIPLSEESALLTSFITPYGWYCFNRLFWDNISTRTFPEKNVCHPERHRGSRVSHGRYLSLWQEPART